MPSSSAGSRHVWVPFGGATGVPRRCFGAMSEAGSETPLASRDATLANTLRPSAKIATSKPHGGGDGPRLAGVVDRRPLQLRVAVVIISSCLLGCLGAVGTPLPQPIAPPNRTNLANWRFWACWARRASGVLVALPWPKNKLPSIPTSGPSFPGPRATERKNQYCALAPRTTRGRPSHESRRTTPGLFAGCPI